MQKNINNFILLVDDMHQIRELLKHCLEELGFQVMVTDNGQKGTLMAKEHRPDLIILDFDMPFMNGVEASQVLKKDPVTRDIPIILLSSVPFTNELNIELNNIGVDAFIMKPFVFKELLPIISKLINKPQESLQVL